MCSRGLTLKYSTSLYQRRRKIVSLLKIADILKSVNIVKHGFITHFIKLVWLKRKFHMYMWKRLLDGHDLLLSSQKKERKKGKKEFLIQVVFLLPGGQPDTFISRGWYQAGNTRACSITRYCLLFLLRALTLKFRALSPLSLLCLSFWQLISDVVNGSMSWNRWAKIIKCLIVQFCSNQHCTLLLKWDRNELSASLPTMIEEINFAQNGKPLI